MSRASGRAGVAAMLVGAIAWLGCEPGAVSDASPRVAEEALALQLGADRCERSGALIEEKRYGAVFVEAGGAEHRYRSIECLLEARLERGGLASGAAWVVDFNHGTRLIEAARAHYVRSEKKAGPDALDLIAVPDARLAFNLRFAYGGEELGWDDLVQRAEALRSKGGRLCGPANVEAAPPAAR